MSRPRCTILKTSITTPMMTTVRRMKDTTIMRATTMSTLIKP